MARRRKPQEPKPEPAALAPIVLAAWQGMTTGTGRAVRGITPWPTAPTASTASPTTASARCCC